MLGRTLQRNRTNRLCVCLSFSRSAASESVTPWTIACQASLSFTNSGSLLRLMSTESVMPSNHLVLCHPLLLRLQSFPASGSFPMKNDALCIRWPKCWSFSTSPSTEYSGLISFRVCQEAPCVLFWICQEFSVPY